MIITKDNQFIESGYDAEEYLSSLGMDKIDIENFYQYLNDNHYYEGSEYWKREAKEWEADSMQQYEMRAGLIQEVQELADKLASGKGGTKFQYAERLKKLCEYWA